MKSQRRNLTLKCKFFIKKNNNLKKKSGYVLIIVMLIVASISLLVMSVTYRVFTGRALISTLSHFSKKELLFADAITIVQSMLSSNSEEEKNEKKDEGTNNEQDKDKKNNKNEYFKKLFKSFWKNAYKWTTYTFSEEAEGAGGKINIYLMCENGKLPFGNIIETILKHNKEKEKKNEKENSNKDENKTLKSDTSNETKTEDLTNNKNDDNSKSDDIFKKENMKFWKDFFTKNLEKSEILKKYINNDSKKEKDILKKWVENFKNYKQKIESPSIFYFFGNSISDKALIYQKKETTAKNKEEKESNKIGDLCSPYSKNLCIEFLSPALMSIFASEKFSFDEKARDTFLKNLDNNKEFDEKILANPDKAWEVFFKKTLNIQYPKEFFSELKKNNLLDSDSIPKFFSAIISVEFDMENLTAFVLFEKITSSNKGDIDYLIKQIIFY